MTLDWDRTFRDTHLQKQEIDMLKRWVRNRLGGYVVRIQDIRAGNILYRGVKWPSPPTTAGQVSYPPRDMLERIRLGRANRAGRSMFYCSVAAPAVFYEMDARAGDFVALSEWVVTEPLWMHNLGYHPDTLKRIGSSLARPDLSSPIEEETAQNARIRRRLSSAFTVNVAPGQEHRYKLSVAINELLFDGASAIRARGDGLGPRSSTAAGTVYPAMQLRGNADNVVLNPDFVDSSLQLRSVKFVEVLAANQADLHYELRTNGVATRFEDGDIIWNDTMPPEIDCRSSIRLEDGFLTMRDGHLRVYDRHQMSA